MINCTGCGNADHAVEVCQTKRVLEQAREIADLKAKLEQADGLFRSADLELNTIKVELGQARMALDGMTGERDDERLISQEQERRADAAEAQAKEAHRRAQAVEGAVEHIAKLHEGFATSFRYMNNKAHSWRAMWKDRYRAAVKQVIAAGVSDRVDGKPDHWRQGNLDVLIARLISERDAAMTSSAAPRAAVWTSPAALPVDQFAHVDHKHCPECSWLTPVDAQVVGVKTMASGSPRLEFTCPKCGTRITSGAVEQVEGN